MMNNRRKRFVCTGTKVVDATMKERKGKLVMVDLDALNRIYTQGFMDGVTDVIGEPLFVYVYTMEMEDEHA